MTDTQTCRVCQAPSLALHLCAEHLSIENLNLCEILTCERTAAPDERLCPAHLYEDHLTTPRS